MTGMPYTRAQFDERRAAAKAVERTDGRALAVVSVGLGLGQLLLIRWTDAHLERHAALPLTGGVFVAYLAVVAWLLWRFDRRRRAAYARCPQCGVVLKDQSERIAAATGRCDTCGGIVIADEDPAPQAQG